MQQTQINIYNERKQFRYGVEYVDNIENVRGSTYCYTDKSDINGDCFQFLKSNIPSVIRKTNKWSDDRTINPDQTWSYSIDTLTGDIPSLVDISSVNVFFPSFGVETYTGNWYYVFSAHTYINGDKIILCERLLDRRDAISYPGKKVMHNIRYAEYINVTFPDPWSITYSDDWKLFRQHVCGEPNDINNTGSLLTIELHPVKITNKGDYVKLDNYLGGMNSLLLSDVKGISLSTIIEYNSPRTVNLNFVYDTNLYQNGLEEYIKETYKLGDDDTQITYDSTLTLFDNNNIYNVYTIGDGETTFNLDPVEDMSTIDFNESGDGWDAFKPGLELKAVTNLICDGLPMLTLLSNTLCVTQDMFASILANEQKADIEAVMAEFNSDPNTQNFNSPDMETINIVNKTQKKVINIEKPNDFKNNLTRPVFIRAQKNNEIVIHPKVTENISINLREYKNYVETFTLKIADTEFTEYGRQSSNIIFKVVGKQLPEELENGIYYVLDDNNELVTSGNYTLE